MPEKKSPEKHIKFKGEVDDWGTPFVTVKLNNFEFSAIIDTGFNGQLLVPISYAKAAKLKEGSNVLFEKALGDSSDMLAEQRTGTLKLNKPWYKRKAFSVKVLVPKSLETGLYLEDVVPLVGTQLVFPGCISVFDYQTRVVEQNTVYQTSDCLHMNSGGTAE